CSDCPAKPCATSHILSLHDALPICPRCRLLLTHLNESSMLIAVAVFVFTLVLVIWQPKGLGVGWSAAIGAAIALGVGAVSLQDIPVVWAIVWNATATFIAVIIISLLLDEAGFFEWAALHVARWARGSGHRLFCFCVLLGGAVSALFANDGAALILTPIVMSML